MRFMTSCFNSTLFRKNVLRFWPAWVLYTLIYFFSLPLPILTELVTDTGEVPLRSLNGCLPLAVVFSLLAAMLVFSYLFSSAAAGMMHSLPIRREGLFLTNYLSGLSFLWGPNLAVFLLTLGAEAIRGRIQFSSIFVWLVGLSLIELYFYSFAVFCGMFAGQILAMPAFFVIFTLLLPMMEPVLNYILGQILFGYQSFPLLNQALWLFPFFKMASEFSVSWIEDQFMFQFYGLRYIFLYAAVAVVLTVLSLLLYRRRRLESAGDVVAVSWARPLFRWGMGLCCSVALATILHSAFCSVLPEGHWPLLVLLLAAGFVGYFIGEMLLQKSFRVFRTGWRGCAVLLGFIALLFVAADRDLFGFEHRVPDRAQVQQVSLHAFPISPESVYLPLDERNPELIDQVLELHRAIVEDHFAGRGDPVQDQWQNDQPHGNLGVEVACNLSVELDYTLTDGHTLSRTYALPVTEGLMNDPVTGAAHLDTLLRDPETVEFSLFGQLEESCRLADVRLGLYDPDDMALLGDGQFVSSIPHDELMGAILTDIRAGNLGRRYLLDNLSRYSENYRADLELEFYCAPAPTHYVPGRGYIASEWPGTGRMVRISLQPSATQTMELLTRWAPEDKPFRLHTWAETGQSPDPSA